MNPINATIDQLKAEALSVREGVASGFLPGSNVIGMPASGVSGGFIRLTHNLAEVVSRGNLNSEAAMAVTLIMEGNKEKKGINAYFQRNWWVLPVNMGTRLWDAIDLNQRKEVTVAHRKFEKENSENHFRPGVLAEAIYLNPGHNFHGMPVLGLRQHSDSVVCMTPGGELFATHPERLLPLAWLQDKMPDLQVGAGTLSSQYRLATATDKGNPDQQGGGNGGGFDKIDQPTVERKGLTLLVPPEMSLDAAMEALQRQKKLEEEQIVFIDKMECHPYDGAHALGLAIKEKFGWVVQEPGPWGSPAPVLSVEVAPGKTVQVPWGTFTVKAIDGTLQTGFTRNETGAVIFQVTVTAKRRFEHVAKDIMTVTRQMLGKHSIYRGRALKVKFLDADGDPLPLVEPRAIDVSKSLESKLVFSEAVAANIKTNLFTPIERFAELGAHGIPFRRGILLAGTYGVGKSELARVAANKAEKAGITFLLVESAKEFANAIRFAASYAPAIVFCEDIDKVVMGVERSPAMDEILNTLDGILSKSREIMVVLTTNDIDKIHPAFIRPGRIDAILEIKRPDATAVDKLMRLYGNGLIPQGEDLTDAAALLQGQIPAVIREVIERAKLSGLKLAPVGGAPVLTGAALADAAFTIKAQIELLNRERSAPPSDIEKGFAVMGVELGNALTRAMRVGETMALYDKAKRDSAAAEIPGIVVPALTSKN